MSAQPSGFEDQSDAELITSVRAGNLAAYGTLYERHSSAAGNLARQLARSRAEADDLVSEAFAKVLDAIRGGKGPDAAFRAYLLTTLRHTAYAKARQDKRIDFNEDMAALGGAVETMSVPFSDPAVAGLERTLAAKAFARLPERWQAVLWHTEIERQGPSEVAPLLGLSANGVSALAHRAREGLRQAYLQVHLNQISAERCRAVTDRLGAWTRDGLSKRERAQVETHLDDCETCRALAAELADINTALRTVLGPLVLGGAVAGYLQSTGAASGAASGSTSGTASSTSGTGTGTGTGTSETGASGTGGTNGTGASGTSGTGTAGTGVGGHGAGGLGTGGAGSGGSGLAAATTGPRQFVGLAVSGIAIAAAVATALATGSPATVPEAGQQPAPSGPELPAPPAPPPVPSVLPPIGSPLPDLPVPGGPITEFPPPNIPLPGLVVPGSTPPVTVQPTGPVTSASGAPTPSSPGSPAPGTSQPPPAPGDTPPPGSAEPPGTTPPGSTEPPGTTPPGSTEPPGTTPPGSPSPTPPPVTQPPGSPPGQVPSPRPRPPKLVAVGPLRLDIQAGGLSVRLALTIRNDGDATSTAVAAKLALPPGIRAIGPGCAAGRDTVTCGIDHGLRPGEAVVLAFRLAADPGARDGRVTGTVTADGLAHAVLDLPVSVGQAPPVTKAPSGPPVTSSEKPPAPR